MALLTDSIFIDIFLILLPLGYLFYKILKYKYSYWDKKGIPDSKTEAFFGSLIGTKSNHDTIKEIYNTFSGNKLVGLYQFAQPTLMIRDYDLINKVLVKDFTYFQDRWNPNFKKDALSVSLPTLRGQSWKTLRNKLTPTFTTGKLRGMFEQLSKSGDNMIDKINTLIEENNSELESKSFLFEFTLDVIASCAFGLQFKPNSPDFNKFKSVVQAMFNPSPLGLVRMGVASMSKTLAEYFNITQSPKETSDYFLNLVKNNVKYRKDNNVQRNDYFQALVTLKEIEDSGKDVANSMTDATEDDDVINQMQYTTAINDQPLNSNVKLMTDEAITSNSFIFLVAGSETVANTVSFSLLMLAQHRDIQKRVQKEVEDALVKYNGWNYDAVKSMTYLDQVIQEQQRMYPLVPMLLRECVQPYKVPGSDIIIHKGIIVGIPVIGLQHDPQYYDDPMTFNPDRFEGNNFKPNPAFLPFGDGPRICIAMRFAVLEVKVCIARIMSEYTVNVGSKMELPIKFNKKSMFPQVEGGIWLEFEKIKN